MGRFDTIALVLSAWAFSTSPLSASILDRFDAEAPDEGHPQMFSVYGDGVVDLGVTRSTSRTSPQAAYVVIDFSQDGWGAQMMHETGLWDLTGVELSVDVRATINFNRKKGVVGFKVVDADGSEYRTPDDQLFRPAQPWRRFTQSVSNLVPTGSPGYDGQLDLRNIVQYGVIFFDQDDANRKTTFYLDNLSAERPE